ncbi:MAG: hypothetical protein Q9160_004645 [Pyrenula sp. 1 TL-2023]
MANDFSPPRRMSTAIQSFVIRNKPTVDIVLHDQQDAYIHSYTTLDRIEGHVMMKFDKDTSFDDLSILFEGQSDTFVEKVATTAPTTGRTEGKHVFLKLIQPMQASAYPANKIFQANKAYSFDFTFVVPEKLLPQVCRHAVEHEQVRTVHQQVPPSLGDPLSSGNGQSLLSDFCPEMARVRYSIRVKVVKQRMLNHDTSEQIVVASQSLRLRILPAKDEEPPMNVAEDDDDYTLRKEKDVRKGLLKLGKIGRLVAEASQPRSLQLHPLRSTDTSPVTTSTTISLRFDPACPDQPPPSLGNCTTKLMISTCFGASAFPWIPRRKGSNIWDTYRGSYSEPLDLSSRCISTVQWERHESTTSDSETHTRQTSTESSRSASLSIFKTPASSQSYTPGSPFWIARISVPISLPPNKVFVPTFHTCIISRLYSLEVSISYSAPSPSIITPHVTLKIPIDIAAKGNPDARPSISDGEAAAIAAREAMMNEATEFLQQRLTSLPSPAYEERLPIESLGQGLHEELHEPPGYSPFGTLRGGGLSMQASAQVMC